MIGLFFTLDQLPKYETLRLVSGRMSLFVASLNVQTYQRSRYRSSGVYVNGFCHHGSKI